MLIVAWAVSQAGIGGALFLLGRAEPTSTAYLGIGALALLGLVAAGLGIATAAGRPNRALEEPLELALSGDLDQFEQAPLLNLGGVIGRACDIARQLRATVIDVQIGAQDLSGAGEGILDAISVQTSGAAEQSAAIAQTSATVEEVKASAQQATQLAESVAAGAREADRIAAEGVAAVHDATGGMANIRDKVESIADQILALSEQTQQISDIIATVSDLADQSNMLALNAAIEATRAGEHGRGFAVVAQEIRALAEQSKVATAQVRTILGDIQRATNAAVMATEQGSKGVASGAQLIDGAGETISSLAAVIQDTSTAAQQIAAAVRQHSVGMEQIDAAMTDISRATNLSLESCTATTEAARALIALAKRLNNSVGRYRAAPTADDLERLALNAADTAQGVDSAPTASFDFAGSW